MSEDQALLYVETVKAILDAAEREVEEEVIREALVERRLEEEAAMEEAERQLELRSLLQRGPKVEHSSNHSNTITFSILVGKKKVPVNIDL